MMLKKSMPLVYATRYHRAYGLARTGAFRQALDQLRNMGSPPPLAEPLYLGERALRLKTKLECWLEIDDAGAAREILTALTSDLSQQILAARTDPDGAGTRLLFDLASDLGNVGASEFAEETLRFVAGTRGRAESGLELARAEQCYRRVALALMRDREASNTAIADGINHAERAETLLTARGASRKLNRAVQIGAKLKLLRSNQSPDEQAIVGTETLELARAAVSNANWGAGQRPHEAANWLALVGWAELAIANANGAGASRNRRLAKASIALGYAFAFKSRSFIDRLDAAAFVQALERLDLGTKASAAAALGNRKLRHQTGDQSTEIPKSVFNSTAHV